MADSCGVDPVGKFKTMDELQATLTKELERLGVDHVVSAKMEEFVNAAYHLGRRVQAS